MKDLLVILAILALCIELYRLFAAIGSTKVLKKKREARLLRKPRVMKPKSERDCPFCVKEKDGRRSFKPETPQSWKFRKGHGGPKKKISTQGYFSRAVI